MSQSNDSFPCTLLHIMRVREGMVKPPFHCAMLFVQEHADRRKGISQRGDDYC